jgi:hypothetical protein
MATNIRTELYEHFDSLGVTRLKGKSECDCEIECKSDLIFTLNREDNEILKILKITDIDNFLLTDYVSYDAPSEFVASELKEVKKWNVGFQSVYITIDIKRVKIRYNPFIFRHQVKYEIKVIYTFNIKPEHEKTSK